MKQQLGRALALLAVIAAVVVAAPTGVPGSPDSARALVGDCTPGADWGTLRTDLATQVVQLVNQHRASLGLSQLAVTTPLIERCGLEVAPHGVLPLHAARRSRPARRPRRQRPAAGLRLPGNDRGLGREHRLRLRDRQRGHAGLAQLARPPRQHRDGELPRDRRRRSREQQRHDLLDAGVRHLDDRRLDAPAASPPPAPVYACSNGADDDGDGKVDYPADPGCASTTDNDEYNAPAPPPPPRRPTPARTAGTTTSTARSTTPPTPAARRRPTTTSTTPPPHPRRRPTYACSNGKDDDFDGKIDYPADTGCSGPTDNTEAQGLRLEVRPGGAPAALRLLCKRPLDRGDSRSTSSRPSCRHRQHGAEEEREHACAEESVLRTGPTR